MTGEQASDFARRWISAWNSHDLDAILSHYEDAIELTSPVAARLLGLPDGKVTGKANLRVYFRRGLEAFPDLNFQLVDVLNGMNTVVVYYRNQSGGRTAEFMEFSGNDKVIRVIANYSVPRPS